MADVQIKGISKSFNGLETILKSVDLTVGDGEFLVLLGPSGCGKTTLLRMIAGLDQPTGGDIVIGGRNVTRLQPKDRNIAMVFQNYALYPHLTIYENIAFPLRVNGVDRKKVDEKVRWAAQLVEIENLLDRKPRQTSGGQRQRTALARSLVRDPAVFLLDEPLSNLDAKLRHSAREELRLFQEQVKVTSIYVTHDQVEAMGLGDRIVVMESGNIRQIGTPLEIYTQPADRFVATFIGSPPMNIVEHEDTVLGFRPEHLIAGTAQPAGKPYLPLDFNVQRVEYLGGERLIYGELAAPWPATHIISRLPVEGHLEEGKIAAYSVAADKLHRFDPTTGVAMPLGDLVTDRVKQN